MVMVMVVLVVAVAVVVVVAAQSIASAVADEEVVAIVVVAAAPEEDEVRGLMVTRKGSRKWQRPFQVPPDNHFPRDCMCWERELVTFWHTWRTNRSQTCVDSLHRLSINGSEKMRTAWLHFVSLTFSIGV